MDKSNYEIVPAGEPISKSGIEELLEEIRPVWKGKNLIQRVVRLLPIDPSSACQRLFNAAIHDLKDKILIIGVDLAKDTALNYRLPSINREEDVLEYNVSKTIDLAYRIGILTRPEWRRIHRCYEIRRDLEHEDDEYEAVLQDCFYIFKTSIDVVLSKDPIELLKVTDAKDLVENSTNISVTEEFFTDYKSAPKGRKKEILELLVSFSYDNNKPDIVRENSVELLRHLKSITDKTVIIDIAGILEKKLGRDGIDLKTAKIGHACGALGYFKKARLGDFFGIQKNEGRRVSSDWSEEGKFCSKLEDIGGLKYCPKEHYSDLIKILAIMYIGERSYGRSSREVFYSNRAAPIISRIIRAEGKKAYIALERLRNKDENYPTLGGVIYREDIKRKIEDKYLLRRYESLLDTCGKIEDEITN